MADGISGYVERFARDGITGWVVDRAAPARRLAVELLVDDRVVGIAPVNAVRPDLASLEAGRTDLGFTLRAADGVEPDCTRVQVRVLGTETMLPLAADAAVHEGVLERAADGWVRGWAWHFGFPAERVQVVLRVDGRDMGRVEAAMLRTDLRDAGIGDGRHGFEWQAPEGVRLEEAEVRAFAGAGETPLHLLNGRPAAATPAAVPPPPPAVSPPAPPPASPAASPPAEAPAWMTPDLVAALRSALPLSGDDDIL